MKFEAFSRIKRSLAFTSVFTLSLLFVSTGALAADKSAVVATAAADYSSGAHSVINVDAPRSAQNNILPTGSDVMVTAYGDYFYRVERSGANNIMKFDISAPDKQLWQYSTEGDESGSNPHAIIFESRTKAYVLRYGSTKAWIVDPSAATEEEFKTGELDLSVYADDDGIPEMHSGVIVDGKLYITLQRVDLSGGWGNIVYNESWVAVFDTSTNTEIDTGKGNGTLKGIPLGDIRNPNSIQYLEADDKIYVQGTGEYDSSNPTSGIVAIDDDYNVSVVIDDGDDQPDGAISCMAVLSPEKGYFVGYAGWKDCTLYAFNPSTQSVTAAVSGLENKNIGTEATALSIDSDGNLWVCNATDARVDIVNTDTDVVEDSVPTNLNPLNIAFTGEAGSAGGGGSSSSTCFISSVCDESGTQAGMVAFLSLLISGLLLGGFKTYLTDNNR